MCNIKSPSGQNRAAAAAPAQTPARCKRLPRGAGRSARPVAIDACRPFIFKAEGGDSDNPADPGRPTDSGITLATLRAYEATRMTADDVNKLTRAVARRSTGPPIGTGCNAARCRPALTSRCLTSGSELRPAESVKTLQGRSSASRTYPLVGPIMLAAVRQAPYVGDSIWRSAQARSTSDQSLEHARIRTGSGDAGSAQIQTRCCYDVPRQGAEVAAA